MIPRIDDVNVSWLEVFAEFVLPNKPFILSSAFTSGWRSRKLWVQEDGTINYEYLFHKYGMLF